MPPFLLASFRVSSATLKQNRELRMSKERYATETTENTTLLLPSTYS